MLSRSVLPEADMNISENIKYILMRLCHHINLYVGINGVTGAAANGAAGGAGDPLRRRSRRRFLKPKSQNHRSERETLKCDASQRLTSCSAQWCVMAMNLLGLSSVPGSWLLEGDAGSFNLWLKLKRVFMCDRKCMFNIRDWKTYKSIEL